MVAVSSDRDIMEVVGVGAAAGGAEEVGGEGGEGEEVEEADVEITGSIISRTSSEAHKDSKTGHHNVSLSDGNSNPHRNVLINSHNNSSSKDRRNSNHTEDLRDLAKLVLRLLLRNNSISNVALLA